MAEPYFDPQETPAARLGQRVYHDALSDRRGFRDDQVGIPAEDEVWSEIFEAIGQAVFAAGYVPASEVQRARDEAFEQAACIADEHEFDMIAIIGKGKGEHGKPGYVTDSTWDAWLGKRFEASAIARRIRALAAPPAAPGGQHDD